MVEEQIVPSAKERERLEEFTVRTGERVSQHAFVGSTRIDQYNWSPVSGRFRLECVVSSFVS